MGDLIDLVAAVDGILQVQSAADAEHFTANCGRKQRIVGALAPILSDTAMLAKA